jgi:hypothetical protein
LAQDYDVGWSCGFNAVVVEAVVGFDEFVTQ